MLQLNLKQLTAAVRQAVPVTFPEMDKGTRYLYENLYRRLSNEEDVYLSDLDFNAFDSEDVYALSDLHENVFERRTHQADTITNTLRRIKPIGTAAAYV